MVVFQGDGFDEVVGQHIGIRRRNIKEEVVPFFLLRHVFRIGEGALEIYDGQIVLPENFPDVGHGKIDVIVVLFQLCIKLFPFFMVVVPADGKVPGAGDRDGPGTVDLVYTELGFLFGVQIQILIGEIGFRQIRGKGRERKKQGQQKGQTAFHHGIYSSGKVRNGKRQNPPSAPGQY